MNKMTVLVYEPGKTGYVKKIPNTLKPCQEIVGGPIQVVHPFKDDLVVVCNQEGRLEHLPENRCGICGTFFICAADGDEFASLSEDQQSTIRILMGEDKICPGK